ncbi:hypothetical protein NQ314_013183, partial [Rhamnusium bicolor]
LNKLWEIEENPREKILSQEELDCEEHFLKNTTRDKSGRYIVKLPFKKGEEKLGESFPMALKIFHHLENKLNHNATLAGILKEFIDMYRAHPALWQIKNKQLYNNRNLKNRGYSELVNIRKKLDPEANQKMVKSKIQSLRGSFRKELKKV